MKDLELEINKVDLVKHVDFLTDTSNPRNYKNPDMLEIVSNYIYQEFDRLEINPNFQEFKSTESEYRNVIGVINDNIEEVVIIGAHYDVFGDLPGADDNASGISGLIELARALKKHSENIPFQLRFVAYANEERPFFGTKDMGSYVHAKSLYDNNVKVEFMVCLEMIGFYTDEENSQEYPLKLLKLFYPRVGNFIGVVSNLTSGKYRREIQNAIKKYANVPCKSLSAPTTLRGVDFSDHRNYWHFGYKAIMITDTSFYRNKNYHTENDTIETLDFEKMKEVLKGLMMFFVSLKGK